MAGRSLQEVRNAAEGDDNNEEEEIVYLEDDIQLEELAQSKTEGQLKEEQAEAEAKGR